MRRPLTGPLILISLGALLLLNNLHPDAHIFSRLWPVIIIVIGLSKVHEGLLSRPGKKNPDALDGQEELEP